MIRLILVRHGNTFEEGETPVQVGAKTDLPLTNFGLQQAKWMAEYLLKKKISSKAIFAGPLKRQKEFASLLGSSISIEPALTEIDYGPWEGLSSKQISEKWPAEYISWNKTSKWATGIFQNSEEHHRTAINLWLSQLKATFSNGDVIIGVTSNGLLRFFDKQEKVKTGHFCDLELLPNSIKVRHWNLDPKVHLSNNLA